MTKADAYVLRHKVLVGLAHEKNLLARVVKVRWALSYRFLAPDTAVQVQPYHDDVMRSVDVHTGAIDVFLSEHWDFARKEFTLKAKAALDPRLQLVDLRALKGMPPSKSLLEILERASSSENKAQAIRPLVGVQW